MTQLKGEVLIQFLKAMQLQERIRKIVFVDDKQKNVDAVHKELTSAGFEVESYRYTAADEKVKNHDPAISNYQLAFWKSRGILLSDFEARALMGAGCALALQK